MYERSNEDGAMLGVRHPGFGLGTNGNVNVGVDQPVGVRTAVPIRDAKGDLTRFGRMLRALRPAAEPSATPGEGVETVWSPAGGGFPGGGGGGAADSGYAPGDMAPEGGMVDMPGDDERPAWLLPVLGLGGLAVVGTGVFLFARSRKKARQRQRAGL
jgi:hypothetical protein